MSQALRFRLFAATMFIVGAGMVFYNFREIEVEGTFSPKFFMIGFMLLAAMPFLVIVGRPTDPKSGKQPLWWHVSSGALALVGAACGAWFSFIAY